MRRSSPDGRYRARRSWRPPIQRACFDAAIWEPFDQVVGLAPLKCLHLNDSKGALGSHLDRHQWIGEGTIGPEPFRGIMRDHRLAPVIKIIETPKGDDPIRHDRRMLRRLRAYARSGATVGPRKP